MARRDIEFDAEGVTLRGWFYDADGRSGAAPTIVMAHGFSAVKEMYLDRFAEAFAAAGLNALVFDNRNFGASDGEPRSEIDPVQQVRDYRHAITYASTLEEVDPTRIGAWRRSRWSAARRTSQSWCGRTSAPGSDRCSTTTARPGSAATRPRWSRSSPRTRSRPRPCQRP